MDAVKLKSVKVYRNGSREKETTLFVQPGLEVKDSKFLDADNKPLMIGIKFEDGEAEVPEQLGAWLIDKGYVSREKQRIQTL